MNITYEQYMKAKAIVEQYEAQEYDDDDDQDWDDDYEKIEEEERAEKASSCTCGAWVFGKDGIVYHVADCCCGAE